MLRVCFGGCYWDDSEYRQVCCFFNMSADMFFGENWHLCIDRKCVRLNPRDQREVCAKGCKQTARKREDSGYIERTVAPVAPLK